MKKGNLKIAVSKIAVDSFTVRNCQFANKMYLHIMGDGISKHLICIEVEVYWLRKLEVITETGKTVWFNFAKKGGKK